MRTVIDDWPVRDRAVWKFPLSTGGTEGQLPIDIAMPAGAEIIHAEAQYGDPETGLMGTITLWALVDPGGVGMIRSFRVYGTGWRIIPGEELEHVGTVTDGPFVWHVFEVL